MDLDFEVKGLDKVLAALNPDVVKKAAVRSLNDLGEQLKNQTVKEAREKYNVPSGTFKKKLKVKKANYSNMKWSMEIPGDRKMNLIHFGARQVKKGVSVKVLKTGARKVVKGAFIANGGKTVFQRKGKERLPIKTVTALSPSQMISKGLRDRKLEEAKKKAPSQFKKNFDYYISKV